MCTKCIKIEKLTHMVLSQSEQLFDLGGELSEAHRILEGINPELYAKYRMDEDKRYTDRDIIKYQVWASLVERLAKLEQVVLGDEKKTDLGFISDHELTEDMAKKISKGKIKFKDLDLPADMKKSIGEKIIESMKIKGVYNGSIDDELVEVMDIREVK